MDEPEQRALHHLVGIELRYGEIKRHLDLLEQVFDVAMGKARLNTHQAYELDNCLFVHLNGSHAPRPYVLANHRQA
ncbi:hypothetical protein D3C78_1421290 [compost metagenome]